MKNLSLALNVVLIIAVGVLYYLHFSGPSKSAISDEGSDSSTVVQKVDLPEIRTVNGAIAYINLDSLRLKYQMYKDGERKMMAEYEKKESEYTRQAAAYQEEVNTFYKIAKDMPESMRNSRTAELEEKGRKIAMLEEKLTGELKSIEDNFNKQLYKNLEDYLGALSKEKNYSYILTYSQGNPASIVFANDSLNITSEVISGLNKAYKAKKSK